MQTMRTVRTTGVPDAPIGVSEAAVPSPRADQALVQVHAVSLNAGEIRHSRRAAAGEPIGWDFAGVVERAANDGTGPKIGARVFGFVSDGAWSDYVAVPTHQLGVIPHGVAFDRASTLPVAGLTALRALRLTGELRGKSVLIVPGTGGVGLFALQLARRAGADVTTVIRNAANEALVRARGAHSVVIGSTAALEAGAKYDLILDSLGGESLGAALGMLHAGATVVSFGQTALATTTFANFAFFMTGGATLYGFNLFYEAEKLPAATDLEHLAALVEAGELVVTIDAMLPLPRIADAVSLRSERGSPGKIVVTLRP